MQKASLQEGRRCIHFTFCFQHNLIKRHVNSRSCEVKTDLTADVSCTTSYFCSSDRQETWSHLVSEARWMARRTKDLTRMCGSYCASSNAMCSNASSWARSIGQHICSVKATLCWSTLYHHVSSHLGKSIFHTRPHEDPQTSSAIEPRGPT